MAHKKGLGSSRNGRDSQAQRLGVKAFGGQFVSGGTILVRGVFAGWGGSKILLMVDRLTHVAHLRHADSRLALRRTSRQATARHDE